MDDKPTGMRSGLASYGDAGFSLYLRKAFIKAMGFLYLRVGCLAADGFKDLWTWSAPPHRHQARRTLARAPWHRTRRCPSGPRRGRCGSPVPGRTRPCGRFEPHLDAKDALMIDGTPATATTNRWKNATHPP